MNSVTLQIFSLLGVGIYFILIVTFLKKKSLSLKYTLTWIVLGLSMVFVAIFPGSLNEISNIIGIETPVNALFAILFFFILAIMMTLTAIVSKQGMRIRTLIQSNSLIEKRVRELEHILEETKNV